MSKKEPKNINIDIQTVAGFGDEWSRFNQKDLRDSTLMYEDYFIVFPWERLNQKSIGADVGCGSGRWAVVVAPKIGHLHLIDASNQALKVAKENLKSTTNCSFHNCSLDEMPITDGSLDFAYSLGVLHHIPDTQEGIRSIAEKLKTTTNNISSIIARAQKKMKKYNMQEN